MRPNPDAGSAACNPKTALVFGWALVALAALWACAEEAPSHGESSDAIQGAGAEKIRDESRYPAVGAILSEGWHVCTGTLVAPTKVLTAKHCRVAAPSFALSWNTSDRRIKLMHPEAAPDKPNASAGFASDVLIYELETPITDVEPMAVWPRSFVDADAGQRFSAVGYSHGPTQSPVRSAAEVVLRFASGRPGDRRWGSPAAFADWWVSQGGYRNEAGKISEMTLLEGYEVWVESESQGFICAGDSGGPLVVDDAVVGVASWGIHSPAASSRCGARGTSYATLGGDTKALVARHAARVRD